MAVTRRKVLEGLGAMALLTGGGATAGEPKRRIALIAGKPSHPTLMHEYYAGCMLLKKCLDGVPGLEATAYNNGWPSDPAALDGVNSIFLFMDGGARHSALEPEHLKTLESLMSKGVGLGCLHYAVEVPTGEPGKKWQEWLGGYYETGYSCNPMWEPDFRDLPKHPITRGVMPFKLRDEWYFNMRFRPEAKGVTPILTATPSDAVRKGPYVAPAGPYEHIVAASGRPELMMWCVERPDGGRGWGFTGGHFHLNWRHADFRKVVLNALVWSAGGEVPKGGIESQVTDVDLYANLAEKPGKPSGPK